MASFSQSGAYNQEAFRYLLESESKRSERSGYFCQILLVYWTDAQGRIVQMDSHVAKTVMAALSRSLRETDYIGWYRDGRIVGAVLTVLAEESMAQVATQLQKRLVEILRAGARRRGDQPPEDPSLPTSRVGGHRIRRGTFAVN